MLFTQKLANYLHSQVNAIAQVRTAMRNLAKITQAHPVLARGIPSLIHLIDVDNGHNHSASFVKLWNMLDSNTFKHEPTTFSIQGRAIAAYHIMQEVKGEFAPMLHAVGELDAFAAVATVFKFHQNKPAHFSFATIINSYTPYLKATNFWHPCLDPEHAITNTVEISADTSPNIVITGPNTGGKTTILKALLANILLAQTFGICTGELELAPYARIHCHMNLTDDIASGTSLFKAEVNHAKKLIESVKGLREGEFAFIVMDEAFRSTAPEQGEQASYKFAAQLAQNKQSNFLIATHYHKLTDLESDLKGAFRNYHVGIILHDDGSFTRTFQFERGASTVNIALALLKEEGVLW
jgi:DNA mismatch repair protein MutS